MYDLERAIDDDVVDMQRDVDEETILAQLRGISVADVREIHQTLSQSYDAQMPSDLRETLDAFVTTTDQETVDRIVGGAELIQSFDQTSQHRVHRAFAELKLQEHPVTGYLDEFAEFGSGGTRTGGFAPLFQEVSMHYE
jgi:hypothetical protein